MSCLQSTAVIAAVPAHDDLPADCLETLYQLDLLLRQHPGEYLASVDDSLQQLGVFVPDQPEGGPVTGKHVVLAGHLVYLGVGGQDARCLGLRQAVRHGQLAGSLLRLHPDDGLVGLDQLAVPAHADGGLDVVPGDHQGGDVGGVQLCDGPVGFFLYEVLHDDQALEVRAFLQLSSAQLIHLRPFHAVLN